MEWQQKTNWYMESDCGYRISKAANKCPGQYAAWAPGSNAATSALAYLATLEEAKRVCADHLNQRSQK